MRVLTINEGSNRAGLALQTESRRISLDIALLLKRFDCTVPSDADPSNRLRGGITEFDRQERRHHARPTKPTSAMNKHVVTLSQQSACRRSDF
jgi:hypothetical protein